jgi:hypothetical protein
VAEVFVGAQGVFHLGEGPNPTLAVSYFHCTYDGRAPEFEYESPTNSFLILASADVKGFHYDANAFFTELVQSPVRRAQYGQSLTISHPFLKHFTLAGEIWHFTQPFLRGRRPGIFGRSAIRPARPYNHGLTSTEGPTASYSGLLDSNPPISLGYE